MPNVETILREHVTLNVDCIDRLYLNGYVPRLQRPENLWWFLHEHRGNPVVSPVLLKHMVDSFFRRWLRRLPHPFTAADRRAGMRYQLSILQMEVSLTQVFERSLHGREFFEEVIRDNLDVGRPDRVQLLFQRRITRRTPGRFRTRVLTAGVQPSLRFDYKHTRVKQYFKLDKALRTETTFNDSYDFDIGRKLGNLPRLRTLGRHINHRLLTLERVAQHCAIASQIVERIVLPTVDDGQRAPALRWGDPRTMALFSALCAFSAAPEGITNRSLRERTCLPRSAGASPSS